jgi:3-hydroxymyristoyl/3-hydroxydecanoyl-(acyl carrier protein) dehydratase
MMTAERSYPIAPSATASPAVERRIEHREIRQLLRQRRSFLLVDRILSVDDECAVGVKNISATDPVMEGHFPDDPIYPGVMLIEAMSQVGGVLLSQTAQYESSPEGYLTAVDKVKFKQFVRPGDQVVIRATKIKVWGPYARVRVSSLVDDREVATGEISYYMKAQ